MTEKPILFSAPMVRAILDESKTQTRRALNRNRLYNGFAFDDPRIARACPYGQPSDLLWVRETWARHPDDGGIIYRATDPGWDDNEYGIKWKPSIFMHRGASRITLEVTGVRVERVQDISEGDVIAEGIAQYTFARGAISAAPPDPRWKFIELWGSINAKRGYGWESNPWVWVVEFKKV